MPQPVFPEITAIIASLLALRQPAEVRSTNSSIFQRRRLTACRSSVRRSGSVAFDQTVDDLGPAGEVETVHEDATNCVDISLFL